MTGAKRIVWFLLFSLLLSIAWAIWKGNGWLELDELLNYPWFIMSLVDVYAGFVLICLWIWYRESSVLWAGFLTILIMVLGNVAVCLYVLLQLALSKGHWERFWLGIHAKAGS